MKPPWLQHTLPQPGRCSPASPTCTTLVPRTTSTDTWPLSLRLQQCKQRGECDAKCSQQGSGQAAQEHRVDSAGVPALAQRPPKASPAQQLVLVLSRGRHAEPPLRRAAAGALHDVAALVVQPHCPCAQHGSGCGRRARCDCLGLGASEATQAGACQGRSTHCVYNRCCVSCRMQGSQHPMALSTLSTAGTLQRLVVRPRECLGCSDHNLHLPASRRSAGNRCCMTCHS